jgi:hypothetical protein
MSDEQPRQGMLDTNILILRRWINPADLPDEMAISAITLAELSAGPHEVRRNDEQAAYEEHAERARRLEILQRAESEFDPVPFEAEAARIFGRVTAATRQSHRPDDRRHRDRRGPAAVHNQSRGLRRPGYPHPHRRGHQAACPPRTDSPLTQPPVVIACTAGRDCTRI